jgi:hypothetical protein
MTDVEVSQPVKGAFSSSEMIIEKSE